MDHSSPPWLLRIVAAALLSLVFAYVAAAANCDVQPLVISLLQQNGTDVFGVDLQLDNQDFQLPISIAEDATIVASAEACSDYYNDYGFETADACLERFGDALETDDGKSADTKVEQMVAKLSEGDIEVKDYSVVVLRQKSPQYNVTGIGLGLRSTFIGSLYDGKHIPTQSFGLGYNKANWSKGIDSLVLGGYDNTKVDGEFYESQIASDGALKLEVTNFTLNWADGTVEKLLSNQSFTISLDTRIERLQVPSTIAAAFKTSVGAESYFNPAQLPEPWLPTQYGQLLRVRQQFEVNLTITLSNGFSVTIPSEQLTTNYTSIVQEKVSISSIIEPPANTESGIFGSIFLSQAYLTVDHDSMNFSLAKRSDSTATSQLERIGCQTSSTPATTAATTPGGNSEDQGDRSASKSSTMILGPILGSLLGAIAILVVALFLIRWYKRKRTSGFRRARGLSSEEETKTLAYQSITSQPSWGEEVQSIRAAPPPPREKPVPPPLHLPAAPSRVSLVPSRAGTPARNSYFTEELDISRP